ncbi:MAG: 30S ribosomal protein S6 [Desulfobacteraceae bacterium 4572_35.1]|nr:MAG: 30S ribosomal protein S6 [Desulfobacteraceae bacterium 4572_35.1]
MRTYETIFIVNPQIAGDDYTAVLEKFKGVLTDQKAELLKVDEWGTKRLAYPVKKHEQGTYVLIIFNAENDVVKEFERRMRLDDSIIKFQTLLLEGGFEAPAPVEAAPAEETSEEASETEE